MLALVVGLVLSIPITADCPEDVGLGVITLGVGSQKVIMGPPGGGEPTFTPPHVLLVKRVEKGLVLLVGQAVGTGTLTLPLADGGPPRTYRIHVNDQSLFCAEPTEAFKALFPCSSTLDFGSVKDRIVLSGEASSLAEWEGAKKAVERFGVLLRGKPSAEVLPRTLREANQALQSAGFAKARFVVTGQTVALEGDVSGDRARLTTVEQTWRPRLELAVWRPKPEPPDAGAP